MAKSPPAPFRTVSVHVEIFEKPRAMAMVTRRAYAVTVTVLRAGD